MLERELMGLSAQADYDAAPAAAHPHERSDLLWRSALGGLALAAGISVQSHAAEPNLQGRWDMVAANSSFQEAVTGPAPDQAVMVVTRDDADHLVYHLVESRDGVEVARGAYNLSFAGVSKSQVDGEAQKMVAVRDSSGEVVIAAPAVGDRRAVIKLRATGPDTALVLHFIDGPQGEQEVERFSLVRHKTSAEIARPSAAGPRQGL